MELRGHSTVLNHAKMPCWILSSSCWKSRWHTECTAKLLGLSLQSTSRQWRGQAARSRCDISLFEHHVNYSLLSCRAQGMSASLRSAKFFFFSCVLYNGCLSSMLLFAWEEARWCQEENQYHMKENWLYDWPEPWAARCNFWAEDARVQRFWGRK